MNPTLLRAWPILIALLGGALLGDALWWGGVQVRTAEAPPGLSKRDMQLPHHLAALTGDIPPDPDAWSLSFHRTLFPGPGAGLHAPTAIKGTATLPPSGRLEAWPAAHDGPEGIQGVGLILDRLGAGSATVVRSKAGTQTALACDGPLPAPGDAPVPFSITPGGGGVTVSVAGVATRCTGQLPPTGPILRSGLRRVNVAGLTLGDSPLPRPGPGGRALWWSMAAGLTALLAALLLALGWRARVVALCLTPLLLAGTLTGVELHAWAETARVLWLPTPWLSALIPAILCGAALAGTGLVQALREGAPDWSRLAPLLTGLPLAGAGALESGPLPALAGAGAGVVGAMASGWLLIRLGCLLGSSSPVRSAAILNGVGSLMALGIALTDPLGPAALAYAHALGVVGGALFWVNANPRTARAYNFTAFALALAVLGCLEVTVRFTTAGQTWAGVRSGPMAFDVFSELETAKQEFSIFDAGRPTAYPSAGYPVRLPARTGAIRVIATGSSSTGGAYQNDRLSDFYPARMQEALGPGYQVINQGVGGWTTFHIDGYVTARIESLDPDVLILYVGHNDQLTALPRPIKEIYSRVHDPGPGAQVAARLAQFRLYQGLRYTVASLRPPDQRVAVPLDHARENLSHIISLMKDRGGRVVLASEGLSPDPGPLVPYFQMLQSLAEAHSEVIFVDTAAALHQQSAASVFLDDSHLTDRGHRLVAAMLAEAIAGEPTK